MFKCCAAPGERKRESTGGGRREQVKIKCVAVGDGAVGKTCLLVTFKDDRFPEEYVPTTFENYSTNIRCSVKGTSEYVKFELWDTAGQESLDELRKMSYTDTDVFLVVFSLDSRTSAQNVRNHWMPELNGCGDAGVASGKAKIVLVGTKSDLPGRQVSDQQGAQLARELGMYAFVSCSARTKTNLGEVFDMVVKAHIGLHPDENIATSKRDSIGAGGGGGRPGLQPAPAPAAQRWEAPAPAPYQQPQWQQQAPQPAASQQWQQPTAPYGSYAQQQPTAAPQHPPYRGAASLIPGLPPSWEKRVDPTTGKPYYTDHSTRQTHWKAPEGYAG